MNDRKVDPIKTIYKLISEKQALSDELEAAKAENKKLKALLKALDIKIETAEDNKNIVGITDAEIRKALNCCIKNECSECPFKAMMCSETVAMAFAAELLDRKDAEIERLNKKAEKVFEATINKVLSMKGHYVIVDNKFVECEMMEDLEFLFGMEFCEFNDDYEENLDNLLKELAGENNA